MVWNSLDLIIIIFGSKVFVGNMFLIFKILRESRNSYGYFFLLMYWFKDFYKYVIFKL